MNIMNAVSTRAMTRILSSTTKFDSLSFSNDGLILKCRNNQEIEIPFADLDKIYIKRHNLNPFVEFLGISIPFLFVFLAINYLPLNLMILVSIISILSIFFGVINYKWYRLYVRLKDGTSFRKKISFELKTENFTIIEKVRSEFIYYNASELKLV
jgi:hypothetical protein